ncbi:MAG: M23 family metallopeptidase [Bacteroidales bacterium]|jgi:hypothetical protein|nr:M23 family metallopeptidase [Bacteroidales bacterium]
MFCIIGLVLPCLTTTFGLSGQTGIERNALKDTVFHHPLDLPIALAGTFGELRSNHFHAGIDFRTQGTVGHKIHAAEAGYVSRVRMSPSGYGKALYITHPNGYTTIYGHLERFYPEVATWVKQIQYQRECFQVDLYPDSSLFPVKRGQIIAFSGNTGSSSGPHLHFELHDTQTGDIINPLLFGFGVADKMAPVLQKIAIFPIGDSSTVNGSHEKLVLPVVKKGSNYQIQGNPKLHIQGEVAFGIEAFDRVSDTEKKCGIYTLRLYINNALCFSQSMNRFAFAESRYINSLIDYEYYMKHKIRLNRMYLEPNNRLNIYDTHDNRGIVSFIDTSRHQVSVVAGDLHGNRSRLEFSFRYIPAKKPEEDIPVWLKIPVFQQNRYGNIVYRYNGIKVSIPADALYDKTDFEITSSKGLRSFYSDVFHVHNFYTPLHTPLTIEIAADSLPLRLREKALIVQAGEKGKISAIGGKFVNGTVTASSLTFGNFAIGVDTVPPRIVPVNIKNGSNMRGQQNIRIKITDNLSGIATCNGWIDGHWVLFEYDAKRSLLFYDFDNTRLMKNTKHSLLLKVTDAKGNETQYEATFI